MGKQEIFPIVAPVNPYTIHRVGADLHNDEQGTKEGVGSNRLTDLKDKLATVQYPVRFLLQIGLRTLTRPGIVGRTPCRGGFMNKYF